MQNRERGVVERRDGMLGMKSQVREGKGKEEGEGEGEVGAGRRAWEGSSTSGGGGGRSCRVLGMEWPVMSQSLPREMEIGGREVAVVACSSKEESGITPCMGKR